VQSAGKMVVIGDVVSLFRPEHDGHHMLAEKPGAALRVACLPFLALGVNLAHADR